MAKPINTWVIGDLHLGHQRIPYFRPQFATWQDMGLHIRSMWNLTVRPEDKVWVLGDAAFNLPGLDYLRGLPGRKFLVRGNHDLLPTRAYLTVFEEVYGIFKYKKSRYLPAWLTHAPIHPHELRGGTNIHGHVHDKTIQTTLWTPGKDSSYQADPRYVNTCPEAVGYAPVLLRDLLWRKKDA